MPIILDLQIHCMLHSDEGIDYQWPPEFVKEYESTDSQLIGQPNGSSAASSSVSSKQIPQRHGLII